MKSKPYYQMGLCKSKQPLNRKKVAAVIVFSDIGICPRTGYNALELAERMDMETYYVAECSNLTFP